MISFCCIKKKKHTLNLVAYTTVIALDYGSGGVSNLDKLGWVIRLVRLDSITYLWSASNS